MLSPKNSETSSIWVRIAEISVAIAAILTVVSISVSAGLFLWERPDRRRAVVFNAWSRVAEMEAKRADGGRSEALRQLRENGEILAGIALSAAVLRDVDLSNSDLSFASLKDVEFFHCLLRHANLSRAVLNGGHFREQCDFRDAKFDRTELYNAVLADSNLDDTQFTGAKGNAATSFNGASMRHTLILNADFPGVIFDNADLTGARFVESRIEKATFQKAVLVECRFVGINAAGAHFQNAQGKKCRFGWKSVLDGAHFDRATLDSSEFEGSSLRGTSFFGATLRGAVFRKCDLRGADFTSADLTDADISECTIEGAIFTNATLQGTTSVGCLGTPVDLPNDKQDAFR